MRPGAQARAVNLASGLPPAPASRRLLYFVSEDWYFWSHRLPLALVVSPKASGASVVNGVCW